MATPSTGAFPAAAINWLSPARRGRVLVLGSAAPSLLAHLVKTGNTVFVADRSPAAVSARCEPRPGVHGVAASPDALPFQTCGFEAVLVAHDLRLLPLGLALPEFARVLVPGGRLAALVTVRDDSVPWVRRLAAILRQRDPDAMRPAGDLAGTLPPAPNFPDAERRDFRRWVPVSRDGLLDMVKSLPSSHRLRAAELDDLLAEVGALYDTSARQPEPLLLPYTVRCTRATVDHAELSAVLRPPLDGLQISLQ